MEQYIKKSALVAEIDKRLHQLTDAAFDSMIGRNLIEIRDFLDTLEVKEVDLEKELIQWHKNHFERNGTFIGMNGFYLENASQIDIARHFFELGLKAQKGEKI